MLFMEVVCAYTFKTSIPERMFIKRHNCSEVKHISNHSFHIVHNLKPRQAKHLFTWLGYGGCGRVMIVFLGNQLKCPNLKRFFFQDGVDEGQRHRPVASQQTGIYGRALDAAEHRLSAHGVGY